MKDKLPEENGDVLNDALTLCGKSYFAVGASNITSYANTKDLNGDTVFDDKDSYGFLAQAKENYLTRIEGCELPCAPVTTQDAERPSIILDALAAESTDTVVKAYYDVALKGKYTRDEESVEMLDLIFANRIFDLGDTIWCADLRDGVFRVMFGANDRAISSKFA